MITLTSFVSRPSLAPAVSTAQGSGSFRVAHRRVNQLGQFTALSPLALDRAFPMTITPQAYQDGDSLLRDEILISNDAGTTWRRAYSGLISSPVTISAWSNSWQVVSIGDTQMPGSALDAGRFNPGSAPSFDIFLLTESSTFSTVSLRLWDTITGSQASMFAGLVQLVYRGQLASGTGALTSGSGVTIWQGSEASTASIPVAGFANQVHKFELTFLGYPPSLPALSLGFELSINRTVYSIDLADDWAEGSLWLNPDKQFLWPPLKPTTTGGNVTVERFAIAGSGVALLNSGPITRTLANGTHWLSMSPTGEVSLASTVPAGNYPVAKAIVSGNVLTRVFPACTFRAPRLVGPAGASLVPYRFINFSNGLLVPSAGTTGSTVRVSTNSTGAHVTSGFALVEAGEAISVGSNIQANSNGKAINESGIGLGVALSEAYADGDLILVQLITASEGGGAITAGEVRDALETLTGTNRLDASAIQNLPSMPTGTQIRDALAGLTGTNRLNASAIFGITTALEALTGNDRLDASAIKNLPGEPSGMQVRLALESLSSELRLNASAIQGLPEAPTGAQIRDALAGLTGVNRLDASAIKNLPSAPTALSQLTNDTNFTTLAGVASVGYLTSVPDNSVTTAKVQDGAITNAKLASGIDAAKITTGTIPSARLDTGTTANKIVQLDGSGRLPALDGSQLTNLPSGGAPIAVQNEGTTLTSGVTGFNFIGEGVTASNSGGLVTVNIPGGGVGGASNNLPIETLQNNNSVSLAFSSVGDTNGLFHYLGRRENTQAFANPVTDGRVVRISGSLDNTNFAKLFDKSTGNDPFLDSGGSSNTVTFELIGGSMSVNLIALFSNSFTAWTITFSGSNDGTNWTTVVQDWQVGGGFNWKTNTTILSSTAYRYWRISHSAGGSPWLAEIEFYGSFFPSTVSTINLVPNQAGKVLVNSLYSNNYQLTIGTNNDFVSGWFCYLRNNTASLITLNPLAGVTISTDGALTLAQNELALLVCTGSNNWFFQKLTVKNEPIAPTQLFANLEPIPLIYQSNGGASDLIHYLGSQGGTQTFVNPVTNGQLTIVSNSLGTSVNAITNRVINNNEFFNAADGTVVYDLGSSRQFQLNRFLINCQVNGDLARVFVRYSNDLTNWTTVINNAEAGGSFASIWTIHDVSLTPPARYWSVRVVCQNNVFASFTEIQMYGQLTLATFSATPILPAWNGKFVYNDLYQNNFQLTIPANNPSFTAGWACYIRNNNASAIAIAPLLGVTLSTGGDAVLNQNEMGLLVCTGSNSWVFQKLSGSNKKFVNASANDFQLFSGNHLLSSGFTAKLPQSPTEMDFVYVNTIKSPQTLVTNQTNVDGLLDGVWTITLSQQPHPIPVWFQGSKWNTHIPFISSFTLDPAVGVNLSTFTSHSSPSGIFDYLGRNNGTSQTYTNPIDGAIISATSTGHLDVRSPNKIADRLRTGNNDIYHGSNSSSPEWMQIQFLGGRSVMLKQLSIRASQQHNINRFVLAGSNNGTNWTNIWDSGADILSSNDVLSPANLTSVYYTYFRFTESAGGSFHFCIGEVELYGILKFS